ncbi:hypothetical protein ABPG72_022840 [Tetrahymena utriculariae]
MKLPETNCSVKAITIETWTLISQLIPLLQSIKEFTDQMESDKASVSQIIPGIQKLKQKINIKRENETQEIAEFRQVLIQSIGFRFEQHFKKEIYVISTIIDPRYKIKYLQKDDGINYLEILKQTGMKLLKSDSENVLNIQATSQVKRKLKNSFWDEDSNSSMKQQSETGNRDIYFKLSQELTSYLAESRISFSNGPLDYWNQNKIYYLYLSIIAKKYLFIPATSAYSERLFSTSNNIKSEKRTRLTDEHAYQILFLNKNQ